VLPQYDKARVRAEPVRYYPDFPHSPDGTADLCFAEQPLRDQSRSLSTMLNCRVTYFTLILKVIT